jgi:hypothetical protein
MVKVFKTVALAIITISVILMAALSISSYVGQTRQEMKAHDYALRACSNGYKNATSSSVRFAAVAASLNDQYALLQELVTKKRQLDVADFSTESVTTGRDYDRYADLAISSFVDARSLEGQVIGLCNAWEANPVSWWPWE